MLFYNGIHIDITDNFTRGFQFPNPLFIFVFVSFAYPFFNTFQFSVFCQIGIFNIFSQSFICDDFINGINIAFFISS